jgi:hypothetical protein
VQRALRTACARTPARLAIFSALALVAQWPLLVHAASLNDFRDAQYFTLFEESARISVAQFHQAPLWNPHYCGGIPALAIPSARFVSPTFLLTLAFGTLRADALIAFVMTVIGLEGAFRYARSRGATSAGAVFAAPVFALCGLFASAMNDGWVNFYGFELVPWAAYGARVALRGSVRGAVLAAVVLAWIVGHGGTYAAPLAMLLCVAEGLEALVSHARRPKRLAAIAAAGALVALLAVGLAAVRLWPIREMLSSSPRMLGGTPGNDVAALVARLFAEKPGTYARAEMLVGALVVPVALVGAALLWRRRRAVALVVTGALWLWLAAGYAASPSLFATLRGIPPFTMLRYPERFLALFALALASLAAAGVGRLELLGRRRPLVRFAWLAALLLLAANAGLLVANTQGWALGRALTVPPVHAETRDFKQARGNRWLAAQYPALDRGTLSCFDDYEIPQSRLLRGDLAHEEYLAEPDAGEVARRAWSPNRIDLHAALKRPARLYVNQNWHPGWRASVGDVREEQGLLAVDLPAGESDVTLRFLPRSGVGGACVSLAALVAAVFAWRRPRARWPVLGAVAAAPLLVGGLALAVMREPPMPPRALVAPTGEPIVAAAPPEDATKLGVRFASGVTLEAARLQLDREIAVTPSLMLELDWRVTSPPPAGMGVFVHVTPSSGDSINVDHTLVSSVIAFEDAPMGTTLRDISIPITTPDKKDPRTWKVYVGLWMARRGGERVHVVDRASADVSDDRILVGTFETP